MIDVAGNIISIGDVVAGTNGGHIHEWTATSRTTRAPGSDPSVVLREKNNKEDVWQTRGNP